MGNKKKKGSKADDMFSFDMGGFDLMGGGESSSSSQKIFKKNGKSYIEENGKLIRVKNGKPVKRGRPKKQPEYAQTSQEDMFGGDLMGGGMMGNVGGNMGGMDMFSMPGSGGLDL